MYDPDELYEEVAFVAYHFGWGHDEILEMPHWERHRWCNEISDINDKRNRESATATGASSNSPSNGGIEFINPEFEG